MIIRHENNNPGLVVESPKRAHERIEVLNGGAERAILVPNEGKQHVFPGAMQ